MSDRAFHREAMFREEMHKKDNYNENFRYSQPIQHVQPLPERRNQPDQIQTVAGWAIGLASNIFAEHILSHPCLVLRRQCQVNHNAGWYHTTPFTLFPVIVNLERTQGMGTLWKGIGSVFLTKGIFMVSETVISEFTPLPKEVSRHNSLRKHCEHILLKGLAFVATTPFLIASLVETVQADVSSEKPGVFDCLKEGMTRAMGWGMPQTTRLIPIWKLVFPTALLGLSQYIIVQLARYTVISTIKIEEQESRSNSTPVDEPSTNSLYEAYFTDMLASFTGNFLSNMMLYPFETVLHRLYLQGTRTIIDNTDTGLDVIPINIRYDGIFDCFKQIILEEGFSGLYKGFGALLLQYGLHALILRTAKFMLDKLSREFGNGGRRGSQLTGQRQHAP